MNVFKYNNAGWGRVKGKRRFWGLGWPAEYGRIISDEERERERKRGGATV